MLNKAIPRVMLWYFLIFMTIACGQFVLFSFMQNISFVYFIAALLWIGLLIWGAQQIPSKRAWLVCGLIGLISKLLWILFVQTPAVSDYALMFNSAQEIVNGEQAYLDNIYYRRFPYQLGFTTYQAMLLAVINSVTFLKFVNVMWCVVASLAVYGIARKCYSERVAVLALLLHVTLLPILVLSSVLTNQHIAVAWFYVGIYLWLKAGWRSWWLAAAAGAALAIGNIMRPIGIVILAAIAVNAVIRLLEQPVRRTWREAARVLAVAGAYWIVLLLAGLLLTQSGISPDGLRNNDPLWKFVAGLNAEMNGSYSQADEQLLNYGYMDPEERTKREQEIIRQRLTSVHNMAKLPFVKIGKMWADFQADWFTFPNKSGTSLNYLGHSLSFDEVLTRYRHFERAVFYLLAVAAFAGILRFFRQEFAANDRVRLLMLIIGAYTFVHLLVEVQSRYMYFLFGIILIFSAQMLLLWTDALRKRWKSKRQI